MRDPRQRIGDMLEALDRIDRYVSRGRAAFDSDELIQSWMVRHLQILGEAARALPPEVRDLAQDIEWKKITGMRHVLVHDYFGIDRDVVWGTVTRDLPPLKAAIERLRERLDPRES